MDKRKQELVQWLDKLEEYARDTELSTRITDCIQECRNNVYNKNTNEEKLRTKIEELLNSIERKSNSEPVKADAAEKTVASEDIEKQLKRMAQNCQRENESVVEGVEERKALILQKCSNQMKEIAWTDANAELIKNETSYVQFYEKIAVGYEKDISLLIAEMLEDIKENYTYMLDHIKSMFHSIGVFQSKLVEEKVFVKLDEQRYAVGKSIQAEIEMEGAGKKQILSFAQKTGVKIKKIVKKEQRKKKGMILFPWLLMLLAIAGNVVVQIAKGSQETVEKTLLEKLKELNDILELLQKSSLLLNSLVAFIFVALAVLLLIAVIYALYVKVVKRCCERSMCRKSAEYLKKELIQFEQSGCLQLSLDAVVKDAAERFEQKYLLLLNGAFVSPKQEKERAEKERLSKLVEEWKNIR